MDGPANEGALCVKGQFAFDFVQHPDRLKTPMVRDEDGRAAVEVDLGRGARPRRRGLPQGRKTSTGARAIYGDRLGTRAARGRVHRCRSSSARASGPTTSTTVAVPDTLPRSPVWRQRSDEAPCRTRWRDMEKPDVIFCIGTNMTECHPVAATRLKRALARGAKMIVADPRRIGLADIRRRLPAHPRGLRRVAAPRDGACDRARGLMTDEHFIDERTAHGEGLPRARRARSTPEWASEICGVPPEDIEQAALLYGGADRGAIYYTVGITEHICGVDNVQSLCNLALMTGNLGRRGHRWVNPMRGQNNIQGAGDCGARCRTTTRASSRSPIRRTRKSSHRAYGRKVDLEEGMTKVTALDLVRRRYPRDDHRRREHRWCPTPDRRALREGAAQRSTTWSYSTCS